MEWEGFRHSVEVEIRFADLDALGHVNNAKYLTYLETARMHYFRHLGLWDGMAGAVGAIMAKATVEYRLPLSLSDTAALVYTRCARLGGKSFDMEHVIVRRQNGTAAVAASGTIVVVAFDYRAGRSVAIPDEWRARIAAFEEM
ncbi:MAG: acyl-CoA thioesterase [Chloroflexi bacterium]|nr:acyl-CoA thioesterase [Chloroflexota bacterium]